MDELKIELQNTLLGLSEELKKTKDNGAAKFFTGMHGEIEKTKSPDRLKSLSEQLAASDAIFNYFNFNEKQTELFEKIRRISVEFI